jgi:hypothetical protein
LGKSLLWLGKTEPETGDKLLATDRGNLLLDQFMIVFQDRVCLSFATKTRFQQSLKALL